MTIVLKMVKLVKLVVMVMKLEIVVRFRYVEKNCFIFGIGINIVTRKENNIDKQFSKIVQ